MSKDIKSKKKISWTKVQVAGFWSIVTILVTFWVGTAVGTQATLSSQANEAQVKTQAVEEYKASLKSE